MSSWKERGVAAVADYDVMLLGFCRSGNVIGMTQLIGNDVVDIGDQGVAEGNRGFACCANRLDFAILFTSLK